MWKMPLTVSHNPITIIYDICARRISAPYLQVRLSLVSKETHGALSRLRGPVRLESLP